MDIITTESYHLPCVATVGFFDGVHAGHRFLINELKTYARARNLSAIVVTFSEHPRKVLHQNYQPQLLTTLDEKLVQLATTGIDACVVLDFTEEISRLSASEFLKQVLGNQYSVHTLLVGHDHRFGHNRSDGFEQYEQYGKEIGMEVIQATRFSTNEHKHISSSDVRNALQSGDIDIANDILSYPYSFKGKVVRGFEIGRKIGFPTANLTPVNADKLVPAVGVYAVDVIRNGSIMRGMMNIGNRPTMNNGNQISIEVHIFNFNENVYGEDLEIRFLTKLRDEQKFSSVENLIEQLQKDKVAALALR